VRHFDDAFLSRIHVALHYENLDYDAREKVWTTFLEQLGVMPRISGQQLQRLASREVNGRQISNAARTAQSLSLGRGEELVFEHLQETLNVIVEFGDELRRLQG
jgi:hypothetical protein